MNQRSANMSNRSSMMDFNFNLSILTSPDYIYPDTCLRQLASIFPKSTSVSLEPLLFDGQRYTLEKGKFQSQTFYRQKPSKPVLWLNKSDLESSLELPEDDPTLDRWTGSITFDQLRSQNMLQFIAHICSQQSVPGLTWSLKDISTDKFDAAINISSDFKLHTSKLKLKQFAFGTLVNGTQFVDHFSSNDINSVSLVKENPPTLTDQTFLSLELCHTRKFMNLRFQIVQSNNSGQPCRQRFKLVYEYESVNSALVSQANQDQVEIYFKLKHPPKIYIHKDDLDANLVYKKAHNMNQPINIPLPDDDRWTRWFDCSIIPKDLIGRCNVLKTVIDSQLFPVNSNQNPNQVDYHTPLAALIVWRRYHDLKIFFGRVNSVKGQHFSLEAPDDFSFAVKYALRCIYSVSYEFQDDLAINGTKDEFESIIRDKMSSDSAEILVEALYKLFYEYYRRSVTRGYQAFLFVYAKIKQKWESNPVSTDHAYIRYIRQVILTPTRVLSLPPSPNLICQFLDKAEAEYTVRVIIRDENQSNIGYETARTENDTCSSGGFDENENKKQSNYRFARNHKPTKSLKNRHNKRRTVEKPDAIDFFLKKCIAEPLLPALDLAGRLYKFYGASSSQLRNLGMVLYAEDSQNRDAEMIRDSIGEVEEKEVSKHIARVGLSLSQVLTFVDLPEDTEVRFTGDILKGSHPVSRKPYNFTDGCGAISFEMGRYIWTCVTTRNGALGEQFSDDEMPSAYQIRFMGCKGMVVLDSSLHGKVIVLRKSMRKLNAPIGKIGILKISEPRAAYLNKPFVTILNQIGLPNDFFVRLLLIAIDEFVNSFNDNAAASSTLTKYSILHRFIDHSKLVSLGYNLLGDDFFRYCLRLVFHQGLDVLKGKARIGLDMTQARTMFGVADPTATRDLDYKVIHYKPSSQFGDALGSFSYVNPGPNQKAIPENARTMGNLRINRKPFISSSTRNVLKEGQVFAFPGDVKNPITGKVLVTKFPCMHPGDVRILEAVDIAELRYIRDCIVFPVDGSRPHANEMAGSDLDGDEYCVIWAPEFLGISTENPMDFPDFSLDVGPKKITNDDIVQFYIDYIQGSAVGRIAHTHLVWADVLKEGIRHKMCKDLAVKYSVSLDFAKTGITNTLSASERYHEAPDFMEKWGRKPGYHSARALGAVYQTMSMFELFLWELSCKQDILEPKQDARLEHPQWKKFEKDAKEAYDRYGCIVSHLLERCDFENEMELLSHVTEKSMNFKTRNDWSKTNNYEDSLVALIDYLLVSVMDQDFERGFGQLNPKDLAEARIAKASAYYMVTIKMAKKTKNRFFGLPWIGRNCSLLCELLRRNAANKSSETLTYNKDTRTLSGGFSGNMEQCMRAKNETLNALFSWFSDYFQMVGGNQNSFDCIAKQLKDIFDEVAKVYITGARRSCRPSQTLFAIFTTIQRSNLIKNNSFQANCFHGYNNPVGQMIVLLLERTYSQGTALSKVPDGSPGSWINRSFRVRLRNPKQETIEDYGWFTKNLRFISGVAEIVLTPVRGKDDNFTLSAFGSPASVMIVQTLIGIHNWFVSPIQNSRTVYLCNSTKNESSNQKHPYLSIFN